MNVWVCLCVSACVHKPVCRCVCGRLTLGLNLQGVSDKGKQGGVEGHRAIRVEWHVHGDQSLQKHSEAHTHSTEIQPAVEPK